MRATYHFTRKSKRLVIVSDNGKTLAQINVSAFDNQLDADNFANIAAKSMQMWQYISKIANCQIDPDAIHQAQKIRNSVDIWTTEGVEKDKLLLAELTKSIPA